MVVPPETVWFASPAVEIGVVEETRPLPLPPVKLAVLRAEEIVPTKLPDVAFRAKPLDAVIIVVTSVVVIVAVTVVSASVAFPEPLP
jgi:hypothetical protein